MSTPDAAPRPLLWAAWVAGLSLVFAVVLVLVGPEWDQLESYGPTSYSYSAHGHMALKRLLEELDIPVTSSRWESSELAGTSGVLLVLEPGWIEPSVIERGQPHGATHPQRLHQMLARASTSLIALPKWWPREDEENEGWAGPPEDRTHEAQVWLEMLGVTGQVQRVAQDPDAPFTVQALGGAVDLPGTLQVLRDTNLDPIVSGPSGVLLGETRVADRRVWVLTDPDLLSNHGLAREGNALLAVGIIEHLRRGGHVVLDETLHGYVLTPHLWRELLGFPLGLLVLAGVLLCLGMTWRGLVRWGSVRPPAPGLEPGNRTLIRHAGSLLALGGHERAILWRYWNDSLRDVGEQLHVPDSVQGPARIERLDALAAARGLAPRLRALEAAMAARQDHVMTLARRIHQWREEILHGAGADSHAS